jgi:hypothetical protein
MSPTEESRIDFALCAERRDYGSRSIDSGNAVYRCAKNKTPTKKSPTKRKSSNSGSVGGGGGGGGGTRTKLKLLVIHYTSMVWYVFNTFCIGSVIFT